MNILCTKSLRLMNMCFLQNSDYYHCYPSAVLSAIIIPLLISYEANDVHSCTCVQEVLPAKCFRLSLQSCLK